MNMGLGVTNGAITQLRMNWVEAVETVVVFAINLRLKYNPYDLGFKPEIWVKT